MTDQDTVSQEEIIPTALTAEQQDSISTFEVLIKTDSVDAGLAYLSATYGSPTDVPQAVMSRLLEIVNTPEIIEKLVEIVDAEEAEVVETTDETPA